MIVNIAFEGGGIKGLTYVGALRYLENRGYKIHRASGTSVGSIFAALVVAGFNSYEIEELIEEVDVATLTTKNTFKATLRDKGLFTIKKLEQKISECLIRKGKVVFKDVKRGNDYLLKIVVTDLKTKKRVIIPNDLKKYGYDPDTFPIAKAVVMSSSLPLYFATYQIKNDRFIDGGISDNFPIDLVIDNIHPVIGLRLSNKKIKSDFLINSTNQNIDIIMLDSLNFKTSQFKKGLNERNALYIAGYRSIYQYYEQQKSN